MKIVFLHNDFKVYWRGRLYFLHDFFRKRNIEIHVIEIFGEESAYSFDNSGKKEDWWECLFETQKFTELSKKMVSEKIMDRLDCLNPDFLVCGPIAFTSGAIGIRWAYKRQKKVIIFDDSKHSLYKRNFLINFIKITLTNLADGILVPSTEYDLEYAKWQIPKDKLYYGLNCIDNDSFSSHRNKQFLNTKKIVCVARLVPIKNLETLLNCWESVEKVDVEYHLIIIGDGPEFKSLIKIKNELELKNVRFLGNQTRRTIAKILSKSVAFILPSFLEGWAMVVNEAMASGLPVLLSNRINAGHTLLKDSFNGYTFNPYNSNEITESILKYIHLSIEEKKIMSENANSEIKKYNYKFLGNQLYLAMEKIQTIKRKPLSLINFAFIKLWSGKFKTANWDTLQKK